jgi:hypothetical protein
VSEASPSERSVTRGSDAIQKALRSCASIASVHFETQHPGGWAHNFRRGSQHGSVTSPLQYIADVANSAKREAIGHPPFVRPLQGHSILGLRPELAELVHRSPQATTGHRIRGWMFGKGCVPIVFGTRRANWRSVSSFGCIFRRQQSLWSLAVPWDTSIGCSRI